MLEPLLSLFALHGLIQVPGGADALAVGEAPALEAVPWEEAGRAGQAEGFETPEGTEEPEGSEGGEHQ